MRYLYVIDNWHSRSLSRQFYHPVNRMTFFSKGGVQGIYLMFWIFIKQIAARMARHVRPWTATARFGYFFIAKPDELGFNC